MLQSVQHIPTSDAQVGQNQYLDPNCIIMNNNDKKSYWSQPKAYANFKDDWERVWTKLEKLRKEKCNQCKLITNSVSNGD